MTLLKLSRRYGVHEGVRDCALANAAIRAIECLKIRQVRPMLPHLTELLPDSVDLGC